MHFKIIQEKSILRRLPICLNEKQKVILNGIVFGVDLFDLSYSSLFKSLWEISLNSNDENLETFSLSIVSDISLIINVISRLRGFIQIFAENPPPTIENFISHTESIRNLRNSLEHLNSKVDKLLKDKESVWGHLTWLSIPKISDPDNLIINSHIFIPGLISSGGPTIKLQNPCGKIIKNSICSVTYSFLQNEIVIDDLFESLSQAILFLEEQVLLNIDSTTKQVKGQYSKEDLEKALEPSAGGFYACFVFAD